MKELKTIRDILQAFLDGHEVERQFEPQNTWESVDSVCVYTQYLDDEEVVHSRYRIKPTKPSIDWDHVHPRYNYLARDKNGVVYLYAKEPPKLTQQWSIEGNVICKATSHISMKAGTCDWTESLVERPGV